MAHLIYESGSVREMTEDEIAHYIAPLQSLDYLKNVKKQLVNELRDENLKNGYLYDFGEGIGPKLMQTTTERDRTNYLGSAQEYALQVQTGNGLELGANIRTSDNTMIILSYEDGLTLMRLIGSHISDIMKHSWFLKDSIEAATTQEELDAIDITTGWPA